MKPTQALIARKALPVDKGLVETMFSRVESTNKYARLPFVDGKRYAQRRSVTSRDEIDKTRYIGNEALMQSGS